MAPSSKNGVFSSAYFPQEYMAFRAGKTTVPAYVDRDGTDYLFLGCCVERVEYDFPAHTGCAFLLPYHCTDLASTVRYFQLLDPAVCRIDVFTGDVLDIVYIREAGRWIARYPRKHA